MLLAESSKLAYSARPLVSALVLNYRMHRDTVKCVKALLEQTIANDIEVLVIDNHSDDESIGFIRSQLQGIPNVRIIENAENIGYGRGNNAALPYIQGEFILIINPDNVLPKDGLERMLSFLKNEESVGIVGPALVYPDGTIRPSARPFPTILDLLRKRISPARWHASFQKRIDEMMKKDAVDVDWMVGACLLLQTSLWKELHGYDDRFFLFFEDIDLCRRIHALGKRVVYLPKIRVLDRKGRLSGSSIFSIMKRKTTRIHLTSAFRYFWKWRKGNLGS